MMPLTYAQLKAKKIEKQIMILCKNCEKYFYFESEQPSETYCPHCGVTVKDREEYPVKTPVTYHGEILFNRMKQYLFVEDCLFLIKPYCNGSKQSRINYSDDFVWVPCNREDIEHGETAYRSYNKVPTFNDTANVCKIIDNTNYAFVGVNDDIKKRSYNYKHWFKLKRKDEK